MAERSGFNWILLLPLAFAALIFGGAYWALHRENPDELPSVLIGQSAPALPTGALSARAPLDPTALKQPGVKLVNFWASWCGPCRVEHPTLMALADSGIPILGVNYKDDPEKAEAFLAELGDPFSAVGADANGRAGLDWGLYGVPETFVIDGDGQIVLRYPGPITSRVFEERIRPAIEAAGG